MTGAHFSKCRKYRYTLWRTWDSSLPELLFIMLNPSTADELQNDPTIERCCRRAKRMGYGSVNVLNIFALRSTDPTQLYKAKDPVGPENDYYLMVNIHHSKTVICGWGCHGALNGRAEQVLGLIRELGKTPYALKVNKDGSPGHPLYIRYDVPLIELK